MSASRTAGSRRSPGGRRRWLAVVPPLAVLVELLGILLVGEAVGAGWTVLLLMAAAALGVVVLVRGGLGGARRAARAAREGRLDGRSASRELGDAGLVALGGLLLVVPGFVSDVVGLACVLPPTRPLVRRLLGAAAGALALRVVGLRRGDVVAGRVVLDPDASSGRSGAGRPGDGERGDGERGDGDQGDGLLRGRVLPPPQDPPEPR
ncbi:FxsA family protein [Pseudokineococcus sp. 5B2Z-1]|uniref:FxsA family protein n=1 Tax=Pseudokineococcus sp. 5B2Z-1 TaxID=3132744 RepID=UPI00309F3E1A